MNLIIIFGIIAILFVLSLARLPFMLWLAIWPLAVYLLLNFGLEVLVPLSVVKLYLCLTILGLLAYIYCDNDRASQISRQFAAFITEKRYQIPLLIVVFLLPSIIAAKIYADASKPLMAPTFGRTIHPAPPGEIKFKDQKMNLTTQKNPFREFEKTDPEKFRTHVNLGKKIYYENCFYCHGDDLRADGMFAHGFFPVPANLNSDTTIGMLQESYLFWRIAKGAPGLPDESGPWSSSMPAWENFIEAEDIWNVILFLYDHTGLHPRAEEEHH